MASESLPLSVALAQLNLRVGDIGGNAERIAAEIAAARDERAALVVFPELSVTGYPPEDLLLKRSFLDASEAALEELAAETRGIVALVGFPERRGDVVHNSAAILADGRIAGVYRKMLLPNYSVFDEKRYFVPGNDALCFELNGVTVGVSICEDIWSPTGPALTEALAGAQLLVNLSGSPYRRGYGRGRERMLVERARDHLAAIVFVNTLGGQDELVFDGHSLAVDQSGEVLARCPQFEEARTLVAIDPGPVEAARASDGSGFRSRARSPYLPGEGHVPGQGASAPAPTPRPARVPEPLQLPPAGPLARGGARAPLLDADAEVYAALCLGLRDYVEKNGFDRVVLGLSGGIDSALTAVVAVDALGADRVVCVSMPSPYSSEGTRADARAVAEGLEVDFMEIPIEGAMVAYDQLLAHAFRDTEPDIAEENLQARIRGNVLMALSNKFGWLVLATGNKSEMSVGYATLYGDMAGGFAPLKDLFKGWVYRLARWRNGQPGAEPLPASVLERPPSAELRADQTDQDSLPPYDVLDAILEGYVEQDLDAVQLVERGLPARDVEQVVALVDRAEYKRRQAPPGIKISMKAFGRDRRVPITNGYAPRAGAAERERTPG
jgi:NAD+ synthase (glutamine-hydrolysing)